jgi:catechol 2,3-dioxygenase-like lactoylglutathione lyase family enzyme
MTSTDTASTTPTPIPEHGEMHLEVVVLPVADVDRAKQFYVDSLGFRLDADFPGLDGLRVVQVTPPGSSCSVSFGDDVTTATPGSVQDLMLVVCDIESCRSEIAKRGVEISEIFHDRCGTFHHAGDEERVEGLDPGRASYNSFASFCDPDGNGWMLQEITSRLPGR